VSLPVTNSPRLDWWFAISVSGEFDPRGWSVLFIGVALDYDPENRVLNLVLKVAWTFQWNEKERHHLDTLSLRY
jgi:hypothetical protein